MQIRSLAVLFVAIVTSSVAIAQPFTLDKKIKPVELTWLNYKAKDSAWNGKINITSVKQVKDTLYFFVKGLSIYQPVYLSVSTKNKKGAVDIFLCKESWQKPDKKGVLENGYWYEKFKTEGSFGIMIVTKKKPQDYQILLWAGKEMVNRKLPSPFKKNK